MASEKVNKYIATIGIECHVQLNTKTKLFSAVDNDAREAEANTKISHIDLGMPGALPVLNEKAVELACRMAFALGVKPQGYSYFERKHYFYPDLPKGYQITQLAKPIVVGGEVNLVVGGQSKKVRINRVQMEEDAGKSTHPAGKDYSLVDLNRAGTPLLEIVSEADMHSPAEAKAYAKELYLLVRYTDISDADLYYGNIRFDVNLSLSADDALGTRTETKNLNSFRSVEKAAEYEVKRQTELLYKGQKIIQETRGWDEAKQKTVSQRSKEDAHDYRYMPEPDIPPLELSEEYIEKIRGQMPVLPNEWRKRLESLGLDLSQADTLLEAGAEDPRYLSFIEEKLYDVDRAKFLANWYVNILIPIVKEGNFKLSQDGLNLVSIVYDLVKANKLSSTNAKVLYSELINQKIAVDLVIVEKYAEDKGYIQVSNEDEIAKIVEDVLRENTQATEDVKKGEMKAIGFLVGQVMKASQGRANPELAQQIIRKQLDQQS